MCNNTRYNVGTYTYEYNMICNGDIYYLDVNNKKKWIPFLIKIYSCFKRRPLYFSISGILCGAEYFLKNIDVKV